MRAELTQQIRVIVAGVLGSGIAPADLVEEAPLFGADDDFDSIASLEIVDAIERAFGLQISDEDLTQDLLYSVGSLARFVDEHAEGSIADDEGISVEP